MLLSFLSGAILVILLYFFRILLVFLISKLNQERFFENFDFDYTQFIFEILLFGFIFLGFHLVFSNVTSVNFLQHIIGVFLVLLVPTYNFVIQPIFYLMKKNNFKEFDMKNLVSVKGYEVKIIDKELVNAYATGIIPFSKTILIGKPLIRDLTNEELLSIQLHEAGHLKKKHLNKLFFVNTILCVIFYFLLVVRSNYLTYNSQILNIVIVGFLGAFYGLLVWYIPGKIQYKFELEADKYSVEKNGKENLINALNKLDLISSGDVSKGGITHPKLNVRLEHIYKL